MFVKEVLLDNPLANTRAVNEAWRSAGMVGTISPTLVHTMRSQMKLTGNIRSGRRKRTGDAATTNSGRAAGGKRRGRPPKAVTAQADGLGKVGTRRQRDTLTDLEADLDRLLFKVMDLGTLPEIEDALRKARRRLYATLSAGS
jgi:hypothetical protein